MNRIKVAVILWFMHTRFYRFLILHILPNVRFTTRATSITGNQYRTLYAALAPGDIILAVDRHNLTGLLITHITGGQVSHAAKCVGKGPSAPYEIAEMEAEGYTKSMFYDICKRADRVIVGTCHDWDEPYTESTVAETLTYEGSAYDIEFILDVPEDRAIYREGARRRAPFLACSELVYVADTQKRLKCNIEDVAGIGRPYVSPEGIRCAVNFVVKADSDLIPA